MAAGKKKAADGTLHTPVCGLLGCQHPIVLAGMGGVARSDLVAAVVEAGGYGFLGMVRESPALIRAEIGRVRARTTRPFGVNLIPHATERALLDAEIEACIEARVPTVALFWNVYPEVVRRFRDQGIGVVYQVGSPDEAAEAEDAGATVLIAQGAEAGGHVRGRESVFTLVRKVVARAGVPVLAAGGIADGKGLAKALSLGAQGAIVGTAFMATHESFAHDYHKKRLVSAGADDTVLTDRFHINWPRGAMVRVIGNSVTRGEAGDPFSGAKKIIGEEEGRPIYLFSTDSPLRSMTGDFEAMALYAGESVERIADVIPAGARLRNILEEAVALRQSHGNAVPS
jgi:nitronate monooxygenase